MTKNKLLTQILVIALALALIAGVLVLPGFGVNANAASADGYTSEYASQQEAKEAGARLNKEIVSEGIFS